ncbi:hypothetical protein SASPL_131840 [Salvia splendens]|uniref:Uncharacterized protein n=1 Tax=Salvia splendens TaxID=180675 RepID=A0A8X8XAS9_SALSN|nr:hypothetical protein SASPL_131840 [Salvia splendens]
MIFEEAVDRCEGANGEEAEKNLLLQKNGWWISSNWAFLNEPPVIRQEGTGHKYVSQFHVADASGSTGPV